ncbi:hypothetical protein KLEP7_gp103 [Pseudaeromonas phage vB_PpeM_ KLEP7]|nr:hypothetical protein KLEP7_gp103 [Pseudaeromonas phage vB_PpeM_ KLEP7]
MKEKLKTFSYFLVVLVLMNPFIFWMLGGLFSNLYNIFFTVFWLIISAGYYYLWLKLRAKFMDIDTRAVKMYKGIK